MSKRNKIISISIFYLQKLKFLTWLSDGIDHRPSNWLLDSLWYADNDLIYDKVVLSLALSVITEKNNYTFGLEKESKKIKQSSSPRYKSLSSTLHWTALLMGAGMTVVWCILITITCNHQLSKPGSWLILQGPMTHSLTIQLYTDSVY